MANNSNKWKELESGDKEWSLRKVRRKDEETDDDIMANLTLTTGMPRGEQHDDTASK